MATEIEASELLIHKAASMKNRGDKVTKISAMAKMYASEACVKIASDSIQIHGGYGYLKDYPLERNLRDLRVHQILEGTNEIMRVIIAREILKENK